MRMTSRPIPEGSPDEIPMTRCIAGGKKLIVLLVLVLLVHVLDVVLKEQEPWL